MNNIYKIFITLTKKRFYSLTPFVAFFLGFFLFVNSSFALPFCYNSQGTANVSSPNTGATGGTANCVLASCNFLPKFLTGKANPGVNCMADCRAMPSGITASEGKNCLFDCNNLASGIVAKPGYNCSYKINGYLAHMCNPVPKAIGYLMNPDYIIPSEQSYNKLPRVNCADLIDLPLCSIFLANANSQKNCVKVCSELNPASIDNRIFNRDCIRFCTEKEADVTGNDDITCTSKKCHHFINTALTPTPNSNCESIKCSMLTEPELKVRDFYSNSKSTYKYCDNAEKCYNFTKIQLDAILDGFNNATTPKAGALERLCKTHTCRSTENTKCEPWSSDDTAKISENITYKNAYINTMIKTINASSDLESICVNKICLGTVSIQFSCLTSSSVDPNCNTGECNTQRQNELRTPNVLDPRCNTSSCTENGVCLRNIDCDDPATSQEDLSSYCSSAPITQSAPSNDITNSYANLVNKTWFYLPKPLDKSYINNNPSDGYRQMNVSNICYSVDDLLASGFGYIDNNASFISGIMGFFTGRSFRPYFHNYLTMDTRSPNYCSPALRHGHRGVGYNYLCGAPSVNFSKPDMVNIGYVDNVSSIWTDNYGEHRVRVCVRYNNTMIPQKTCGSRECGITCFCEDCSTVCGFDECREISIKDNSPRSCANASSASGNCVSQIADGGLMDSYIRVRAVGFENDNRVCAFLDFKSGLAYNSFYDNGSEALPEDPTKCYSGTYDTKTKTCVGGKNSNDDKGSATVWRSLGLINYIDGNTIVSNVNGIKDVFNNFYPKESCIKYQLRSPPPNFFNIANVANSRTLFGPAPYILNSRKKKGDDISPKINPNEMYGNTDFNEPEVEIAFGTSKSLISLSVGKTGNETGANVDSASRAILTTSSNGINYSTTIFSKKTTDPFGVPRFCIYRELRDRSNQLIDPPPLVGCVVRNFPKIDNCDSRDGICFPVPATPRSEVRRKILLSKDLTAGLDGYDKITVKFRYLVNYNDSNIDNTSCTGNVKCSNEISVPFNLTTNPELNYNFSVSNGLEAYPISFTREFCSMLNMECIANQTKIDQGDPLKTSTETTEKCNNVLITCNQKKNISSKEFDPSIFNQPANYNYYGWFNEVCLTKGFDHDLKMVYAYKVNNQNGKCIVDPNRVKSGADCSTGGKMPDCPCTEFNEADIVPSHIRTLSSNIVTTRQETYREAGLCVDISFPALCPKIKFVLNTRNFNPEDPYYIANSINKFVASGYDDLTGVHTSHKYRTEGKASDPYLPIRGNAEFNAAVTGTIVRGNCVGFWRHRIVAGIKTYPLLRCNLIGGIPQWNSTTESSSSCQRYACAPETSTGIDPILGEYENNYGSSELNENKGNYNGFAYWDEKVLTTDFAVTQNASSCIVGFRANGSTTQFSYPTVSSSRDIDSSKKTLANASLFGAITSYTGGTLPSRVCNQIGQWQPVSSNICVRISCPAINPGTVIPASSNTIERKFWERSWEKSGGATYNSINASRNNSQIVTALGLNSRAVGTCETSLGYYQASPSTPPTMDCNHLGNWTNLQNPCLNDCSAIPYSSTGSAHGYAVWNKKTMLTDEETAEVSGACGTVSISGGSINYYNYPYPPFRKNDGTKYTLVDSGADYINSIPRDISSDTRVASAPKRICTKSIYSGLSSSQWSGTNSTCVTDSTQTGLPNGCVTGFPDDSNLMADERIGAGVTQHSIRNSAGTVVSIRIPWNRKKFGEYEVKYCDNGNSNCTGSAPADGYHNSSNYYSSSRSQGRFILVRYCNSSTKKWDDPVPYCVAYGDLGNSLNASATTSSTGFNGSGFSTNYFLANTGTVSMSCNSGYIAKTSTPSLICQYGTANVIDTLQLVKQDGNYCSKYCIINSNGTIPGTSYSQLRGTAGTYYSGDTTTLTCTAGNECGGSQSVVATCTDSGWSIPAPSCRACNGCNNSSGIGFDEQRTSSIDGPSCTVEQFNMKCMLTKAKENNQVPSKSHSQTIVIEDEYCADCGLCSANYCLQGRAKYYCSDGTWQLSGETSESADFRIGGDCTAW